MPSNMVDCLRTALTTRQQLADYHAMIGDLDEKHMHAIEVLGKLFHSFCREQVPSVSQLSPPEACNYFIQPFYEPAPFFEQQFDQQQYAFPEYYVASNEYTPFYPQPPPPFAPLYPTAYPPETEFGYFGMPTPPFTYTGYNCETTTNELRPTPEERPSPPQNTYHLNMPPSPALSTSSSFCLSEEDFPALPKSPSSS